MPAARIKTCDLPQPCRRLLACPMCRGPVPPTRGGELQETCLRRRVGQDGGAWRGQEPQGQENRGVRICSWQLLTGSGRTHLTMAACRTQPVTARENAVKLGQRRAGTMGPPTRSTPGQSTNWWAPGQSTGCSCLPQLPLAYKLPHTAKATRPAAFHR
jgi:hypothetical protein